MEIFREDDMATDTVIDLTGTAVFPLVEEVKLEGLTLKEAADKLSALYDADYFVEPKLTLKLAEASPVRVMVGGAVNSPGTVSAEFGSGLDALSAIYLAGGLSESAKEDKITLTRAGKSYEFSLDALQSRGAKPVPLHEGDRLVVAKLSPEEVAEAERVFVPKVYVLGQVGKPGKVEMPTDGELDLLSAVALAGGFTRLANEKKVLVRRSVGGRVKQFTLNAADMAKGKAERFILTENDVITVKESLF